MTSDLELFRDWTNNWLTVERFAEHHGLSTEQAETSIALGREEHNAGAAMSVDEIAAALESDD